MPSPPPKEPKFLRAYGDREGDGVVQLSFTLRVEPDPIGKEAARVFAEAHGLSKVLVVCMERCGPQHTYFVAYGQSKHEVALHKIAVPVAEFPVLEPKEIDKVLEKLLGRKLVVVGACTGTDAHTVGIDAILNMKGYAGDKGLESYTWIDAYNLGAQMENEALVARAQAVNADAILVSQVVTQRDCHAENGRALIELLKSKGLRQRFILLFGGPRIDHKLALQLGFDAGFGPGTLPRIVASFLVHSLKHRQPSPSGEI